MYSPLPQSYMFAWSVKPLAMYVWSVKTRRASSWCGRDARVISLFFLLFFLAHFYFPASDKPWSQVSSLLPLGSCLNFYLAYGSAIPLLVDFSSSVVANSRSRVFRKLICAQQKSRHEFIRVCTRGDSNSRY